MFTLSDPSLVALHKRLLTNLAANIDAVNTMLTNPSYPIAAPPPERIFDFVPTISYMTDYPCVAISDGPIDFVDDVGWGATGVMDFAVIVWAQSYDQRELAWMLRRYMVAIANTVLEGRSLANDGGGWSVQLGTVEPGPVLGQKDHPGSIIGMRALSLNVKDEQDD